MGSRRCIGRLARVLGVRRALLRVVSSEFRDADASITTITKELMEAGFEAILHRRSRYPEASGKYLDVRTYLEEAIREAKSLGLWDSPSLRVLDIGCGTGYFLYVARSRGHDILGLDLNDNPMYNDVTGLLRIPRTIHRVEKFRPLPDIGRPFDLITAFSICFDCHGGNDVWGVDEWEYFVSDCRSHLSPGGRLLLNFNPATKQAFTFIPDEVAQMLRDLPGACLSPNKERFLLNHVV